MSRNRLRAAADLTAITVAARVERLRTIAPYDTLDHEARVALARAASLRAFERREKVLYSEQRNYDVLFVWKGGIDVVRKGGTVVSVGEIAEGQSFGFVNAIGGVRHGVDYEAVRPTVLLMFPQDTIRALAIAHPPFLFDAVAIIGQRMRTMRQEIALLQTQDPASRVLHALQRLEASRARGASDRDAVTITHAALATHVGTRRETVTRALSKLAKAGLVVCGRGTVRLVQTP